MTDLIDFKVEIPERWVVATDSNTLKRFRQCIIDAHHPASGVEVWEHETPTRDTLTFEGRAPKAIVTLFLAAAHEHDIRPLLDALPNGR